MNKIFTWTDCALIAQSRGMRVDWGERYFFCPHCGKRVEGISGEMSNCPHCHYNFMKG